MGTTPEARYTPYTLGNMDAIPQLSRLSERRRLAMRAVAHVLPFRTNRYVVDELIDWDNVPDDPMFQLTFPQPGMLEPSDLAHVMTLLREGAARADIRGVADRIRLKLNPHPAGQLEQNVPDLDGEPLPGLQHKYRETLLFFPGRGQTCHAYCTYCFRWAQFVGMEGLKFSQRETETFHEYLRRHTEVSDVLFTGGDPMVMRAWHLRAYIEPLLGEGFEHIRHIRIGTKSLGFHPYKFVTDPDADEMMRLFEDVAKAGKHLAFMAHFTHPRELETPIVQRAIERIRATGAVIRSQAPVVRHVNDSADTWADMWRRQVALGVIPYYMFVERDTGPKSYFELPLARTHAIYRDAFRQVSGLARTVRGPSMSATPGKVLVLGTQKVHGEKVFVLTFLRGRDRDWVGRPFFARYDERATWLDDLQPAFGERRFFFEQVPEDEAPRGRSSGSGLRAVSEPQRA
ncbi:MAG: lysine 2,3-aminomutase [Gammaproteobacteria bacterium SG8_30]|jgi:KamA family protein|nr:MAG: lysine 2,3-aminomutase [Gammaproteobacteria bacterium SG8_30]